MSENSTHVDKRSFWYIIQIFIEAKYTFIIDTID